jgi:hypothetical protein
MLHQSSTSLTTKNHHLPSHTNDPQAATTNASAVDEHPSPYATFFVVLFFFLPQITVHVGLSKWVLRVQPVRPITILVACHMALFLAHVHTIHRFRHPAGVLLQFLNYNIIIMYPFIDSYLSDGELHQNLNLFLLTQSRQPFGLSLTLLPVSLAVPSSSWL